MKEKKKGKGKGKEGGKLKKIEKMEIKERK